MGTLSIQLFDRQRIAETLARWDHEDAAAYDIPWFWAQIAQAVAVAAARRTNQWPGAHWLSYFRWLDVEVGG